MSNRSPALVSGSAGLLAPFAVHHDASRGRFLDEPASRLRSPFQRDRDRIIHSSAFRRLEYKTQVFVNHEGDHFRTRLTHTLEVAQVTRTAARALRLNEDLAEAVALAHDLGHSPFGHAGEAALDHALRAFGGFDHNAQTLKVITSLENRYAAFDGLNLTFETLEGVVKHNGPRGAAAHPAVLAYSALHDLALDQQPSAEAQVAAVADDIAYSNHDLDDGLRAGLFELDAVLDLPLAGPAFREVLASYPDLERPRLIHEGLRRVIDRMVGDLVDQSQRRLAEVAPARVEDVRAWQEPLVGFGPEVRDAIEALRSFLHEHMYGHYRVRRMARKAQRIVDALFGSLIAAPDCLPPEWRARAAAGGEARQAIAIGDYIAGMTDRFALDEYDRLVDLSSRRL